MNATFEMLEKEGIQKGERAENAALICRQLRSRFGTCPDELKTRVKTCPKRSIMRLLVDAAYQCRSFEQFESTVDLYLGK